MGTLTQLQRSQREFPVGSRVTPDPEWDTSKNVFNTFNRYETRGFMIVTDYSSDGFLKFDNRDFTKAGGAWNPKCFIKLSILPEDLFKI